LLYIFVITIIIIIYYHEFHEIITSLLLSSLSFSSLLAQSCYLNHHEFAAFLWVVGDAGQHQGANRSSEANNPTATWMGWGFLLAGSITCGAKFRSFEH